MSVLVREVVTRGGRLLQTHSLEWRVALVQSGCPIGPKISVLLAVY